LLCRASSKENSGKKSKNPTPKKVEGERRRLLYPKNSPKRVTIG